MGQFKCYNDMYICCIYRNSFVFYYLPKGIYAEILGFLLRLSIGKDTLNMCFLFHYKNHTKGKANLLLEYF